MLTPARSLKSSPIRCGSVPAPTEAMLSLPGLAFATRISSCTVLMPRLGVTTRTFVLVVSRLTGAKSRAGSYGKFDRKAALM